MSLKLVDTLSATGVDNSKIVDSSGGKNRKLDNSDFTKPMRRAEEPSFLTPNTRLAFTKLRKCLLRPQSFDISTLSTIFELKLMPLAPP